MVVGVVVVEVAVVDVVLVLVVVFTCARVLPGLLGSSVLEGLVALAGCLVQSKQGGQLGSVEARQQQQ